MKAIALRRASPSGKAGSLIRPKKDFGKRGPVPLMSAQCSARRWQGATLSLGSVHLHRTAALTTKKVAANKNTGPAPSAGDAKKSHGRREAGHD